jgi:hypothetical protein
MSEPTTPTAPTKVKLAALLEKATAIAQGADKAGVLPGAEGHDESSAPNTAMRWCASILRIFLLRVIEHVIATRNEIGNLRGMLQDPQQQATWKKNPETSKTEPWRTDLPALRAQVKEMSALLNEIVEAIKTAQTTLAETPTGPPPPPGVQGPGMPGMPGMPTREPTIEEVEKAQTQAQIDELAAALARGEPVDLAAAMAKPPIEAPIAPVVPITGPGNSGKRRNPAGNEKVT